MGQVGRNEPCPCGSRRKYKRCCLSKNEGIESAAPPLFADAPMHRESISIQGRRDLRKHPLSLDILASMDISMLRGDVLSWSGYSSAVEVFQGRRFQNLELRREDRSFVISVEVVSKRDNSVNRVSITTTDFDQPIQLSCGCSVNRRIPRCQHAAFLLLASWSALRECYDFERIFPSITDHVRTLAASLRFFFPGELNAGGPKRSSPPEAQDRTLSESCVDLKLIRLLFCPPSLDILVREGRSLRFPDEQEAKLSPTPTRLSSVPCVRNLSLSDVPQLLSASSSYRESKGLPILKIFDTLQYEFSDGTVLSVGEILHHPLAAIVPRDMLPLSKNQRVSLTGTYDIHLHEGISAYEWRGEAELEHIILSILINASRSPEESQVGIALAESPIRTQKRGIYPLSRVELMREKGGAWVLEFPAVDGGQDFGRSRLIFRSGAQGQGTIVYNHFEIEGQSKTLSFHPYLRVIRAVNAGVGRQFGDVHASLEESSILTQFDLRGHQLTYAWVSETNQRLEGQRSPQIELNARERLPRSKLTPVVWLTDQGEMKFMGRAQSDQGMVEIWNLPLSIRWIIDVVNGGIGSVTGYENTLIAQKRRGEKRDRDLFVLKHTGLAALLFHEILSHLLQGPEPEPEPESEAAPRPKPKTRDQSEVPLKKRDRKIFDSLGKAIALLEGRVLAPGKKPPSLDQLCSRNVQQAVSEIIERLSRTCQLAVAPVFTPEGLILVDDLPKAALEVIHSLLQASVFGTQGALFAKARTRAFESLFLVGAGSPNGEPERGSREAPKATSQDLSPAHRDFECRRVEKGESVSPPPGARTYCVTESHRTPRAALAALLPLMTQGFEIYWNGAPLLIAEEGDLRAELMLSDRKSDPLRGGKVDWFELHPQIFFRGVEIDRKALKQMATEGVIEFQGKFYLLQEKTLPSVKRLEEFWNALQEGNRTGSAPAFGNQPSHYLLPRSRSLELLALRSSGTQIEGGPEWQEICRFYDALDSNREPDPLPASIYAELKPYQKLGVQWLLDLHRLRLGGILADDMGLGKTLQTLAFLEKLRVDKRLGRGLIVVPTTLTYNWKSESTRFTPELPMTIFQPREKELIAQDFQSEKDSVWIITYGLFVTHAEFLSQFTWDFLIFDEAQNLKNIAAKRTTHARSLEARFKLCLTGTPMENHIGELYSLLDLAVPGCLGDLTSFRTRYVSPERVLPEDIKYLRLKAKPLILRRTKGQILSELPPKTESKLTIPFESKQLKIYRDIALSWNEKVKGSILSIGEAQSQLMMLTALLRLRQACSDPSGIPGVHYAEVPPKISALLESLEEISESGESALVFTQFRHTLDRLSQALQAAKITHFVIHGAVSRKERERILQAFQESERGSILLMTLKTGGVGLNLVKASYVFHVEPWWNPAAENQATDRAHRMGQTRPVQVFRYIMGDSVEEKIESLKERKSSRFRALFSEVEGAEEETAKPSGSSLSQEDFAYLLS
jgi:superfamily II DNA or RNA helicase